MTLTLRLSSILLSLGQLRPYTRTNPAEVLKAELKQGATDA